MTHNMADKAYLRDSLSGKTEFLPRKYLRLFPNLQEVRTGKSIPGELNKPRTRLTEPAPGYYDQFTVAELQSQIDDRNEGRDETGVISPSGRSKADLIAALDADDIHTAEKGN